MKSQKISQKPNTKEQKNEGHNSNYDCFGDSDRNALEC